MAWSARDATGGNALDYAASRRARSGGQGRQPDPYLEMSRRADLLIGANPDLMNDPDTLLALTRSSLDDADLARAAAESGSMLGYTRQAEELASAPLPMQRSMWNTADPHRKQMLVQAGYQPPAMQEAKGNSFFDIGVGLPTWVPVVGGRHVTIGGHDNPILSAVGGAVAAPFDLAQRGVRNTGGMLFDGMYALGELVTNVPRAFDRSDWGGDFEATRGFDIELRDRVERRLGREVDDATWRATVNPILNMPDGAENPAAGLAEVLGPAEMERAITQGNLGHFMQLGGELDRNVRQVAEEAATQMREEGITESLTFWDAWGETWNGESYIMPEVRNKVAEEHLDGDYERLRLAEELLTGRGLDELAAQNVDPSDQVAFQAEYTRLLDLTGGADPEAQARFEEATAELANGRYSIGREAARSAGLTPDSLGFHLLSGGLDAAVIMLADPTLVAGKAYRGVRGAAWAVGHGGDVLNGVRWTRYRAKAALGLGDEINPELAGELLENIDAARALRIAGELGLDHDEAYRILGDRVGGLSRSQFNEQVRAATTSNAIARSTRGARTRGAVSQWLAAERIATTFRRADRIDEGREALDVVRKMDPAQLRRAVADGDVDDIWNLTAFGDLTQDLPHITGALQALVKHNDELAAARGYGIRTADDIFDFYESVQGATELVATKRLRGSSSWQREATFELPRLTPAGRRRIRAKQWFNDVIDWTHDATVTLDGPATAIDAAPDLLRAMQARHTTLRVANATIGRALPGVGEYQKWAHTAPLPVRALVAPLNIANAAVAKVVTTFGDLTHSLTTMLPVDQQLNLANEGLTEGIPAWDRLIEFTRYSDLPSSYRHMAFDQFVRGDIAQLGNYAFYPASPATRGLLFRSLITDMLDHAGVTDSPEVRNILETWSNQRYAPGDIDLLRTPGGRTATEAARQVVPGVQGSTAVAMPNFKDFTAHVQRNTVMRKLMGKVNNPVIDSFFSSYWRPAMLLRIGFIPRAAGEEILSFALRDGISNYFRYSLAAYGNNTQTTVQRVLADGTEVFDLVPRQVLGGAQANRMLESLNRRAAHAERIALGTTIDRLDAISGRVPLAGRIATGMRRATDYTTVLSGKGMLAAIPNNHRRMWVHRLDGTDTLHDSLADVTNQLHRNGGGLAYVDVPANQVPGALSFPDNFVPAAVDVDLAKLPIVTPLSPVLVLTNWMATQAAQIPRAVVRTALVSGSLNELAREVNTARLAPEGASVDELAELFRRPAAELAYLPAMQDAMARVDGVGRGGRWYQKVSDETSRLRVPGGSGQDDVILTLTREFEEIGASDPMFAAKVTNTFNALLDPQSWAVRAAVEDLGGFLTEPTLRKLDPIIDDLFDAMMRDPKLEELARLAPVEHITTRPGAADGVAAGLADYLDLADHLRLDMPKVNRWLDAQDPAVVNSAIAQARSILAPAFKEVDDATTQARRAGELMLALRRLGAPVDELAAGAGLPLRAENIAILRAFQQSLTAGPDVLRPVLQAAYDEGLDAAARRIPKGWEKVEGTKLTNRQILDDLAERNHALRALIERWDDLPSELLAVLAYDRRITGGTADAARAMMRDSFRRVIDEPLSIADLDHVPDASDFEEMGRRLAEVVGSERMLSTSDGTPAAFVRPDSTSRQYVPMLDDVMAERLTAEWSSNPTGVLAALDQLTGAVDESVRAYILDDVLPFLTSETVDSARFAASVTGRGATRPTIPIGVRATSHPDLAREAAETLQAVLHRIDPTQIATRRKRGTYGIIDQHMGAAPEVTSLGGTGRYAGTNISTISRVEAAGQITPVDDATRIIRYSKSPDGKLRIDDAGDIVVPGASPQQLRDDWADRLVENMAHHFMRSNGEIAHEVLAPGLARRITQTDVQRMGDKLPETIIHQALALPVGKKLWERTVAYGFDEVIGPAIRSMIRNPMFLASYREVRAAATNLYPLAVRNAMTDGLRQVAKKSGVNDDELISLWSDMRRRFDELSLEEPLTAVQKRNIAWREAGLVIEDDGVLGQLDEFVDSLDGLRTLLIEQASMGAVNDMTHLIDDHRFRSHMAGWARNIAPFWFAEETFLKRWARTLKHSPEAFRRAQLYMGGLREMGFVHRDEYGQEVFTYPGSQVIQEVLAPVTTHFFGGPLRIPVSAGFTGQVKYAMPGMDRQGIPSFSPLVAIPFGWIANQFPELGAEDNVEAMFGTRSTDRSVIEQFVPAWLVRTAHTVLSTDKGEERMAGLAIQAIQQMEAEADRAAHEARQAEAAGDLDAAEGHRERERMMRFPANGSAYDVEVYNTTVRNWSRNLMVSQAVLGFFTPTTPIPTIPDEVTQQYLELVRAGMPFEEALGYMLSRDPGATPYTRFATTSTTGAVLPTHVAAGEWVAENQEWMNTWRHAGAWMIPQPEIDDEYHAATYYEQLGIGLRARKAPEEFLMDLKFAEAAPIYFAGQRDYEARKEELQARRREAGGAATSRLDELLGTGSQRDDIAAQLDDLEVQWRTWQSAYLEQHPLFAERLRSPEGKERRAQTLSEIRLALADPAAPEVAHRGLLSDMVDSYDTYTQALDSVKGRSDPDAQEFRRDLRDGFAVWADGYVTRNPTIRTFYQSVIAPEVGIRHTVLNQES